MRPIVNNKNTHEIMVEEANACFQFELVYLGVWIRYRSNSVIVVMTHAHTQAQ